MAHFPLRDQLSLMVARSAVGRAAPSSQGALPATAVARNDVRRRLLWLWRVSVIYITFYAVSAQIFYSAQGAPYLGSRHPLDTFVTAFTQAKSHFGLFRAIWL